jgi:hypothetical protein
MSMFPPWLVTAPWTAERPRPVRRPTSFEGKIDLLLWQTLVAAEGKGRLDQIAGSFAGANDRFDVAAPNWRG